MFRQLSFDMQTNGHIQEEYSSANRQSVVKKIVLKNNKNISFSKWTHAISVQLEIIFNVRI